MDLCSRGQALSRKISDFLDSHLTDLAVCLINQTAAERRVSPHHLALAVPGVCHAHSPDTQIHADCSFCHRRGNYFASAAITVAAAATAADQASGG